MKSKESEKNNRWGYLYVVLAALMWALSGSSAKFLFNSGITPFQLVPPCLKYQGVIFYILSCSAPWEWPESSLLICLPSAK
jgi:drug/metabolite transporter (DMT)-like permease